MTVSLPNQIASLRSADSVPTDPKHDAATVQPVWILAVMMALIPALGVPNEFMLQDTLKSAVLAVGVLLAALLFVGHSLRRARTVHWHGLMWLPLSLCIYAVGSMVWSHGYLAGVEAVRWGLLSLLLWTGLNTFTRANLPVLVWGIHAGATAASLWAVLQGWVGLSWFPQVAMPASTFVNRNFFAEYLVCTLPFSVYALVQCCKARWALPMALSLALNTVALLMTGTRSATLAFLLTLPLMAWTLWRHRSQWTSMQWPKPTRRLSVAVLVVGLLGLGLLPMDNQNADGSYTSALWRSVTRTASVTNPAEYTQGSFYVRSTMWKATARMVMAHPWTGVGAGAWEVHIPRYQALDAGSETDFYAHNDFLQLLGEYGLVLGGGFCAVLLAYGMLAIGRRCAAPSVNGADSAAPNFALLSLLALGVVSMAGFPSRMASTCAVLAVCLAVLAADDTCSDFRSKFYGSRLVWHPKALRAAAVLLAVALLSAGYFIQRAVRAEYLTVLALKQGKFLQSMTSTEKSAWQNRVDLAIRLNPHNRKLTTMLGDQLAFAGDWMNAARVWESITASRPHVADLWANIAIAYGKTNHSAQALQALEKLKSLQPNTPRARALEIAVWRDLGLHAQAMAQLTSYFDRGVVEPDLVQMAYSLGLQTQSWPLAIRALHLGIQQWPASAADAYFRLGEIYNDPRVGDKAQAVTAFQLAMATLAPTERAAAITRVPADLRSQVTLP